MRYQEPEMEILKFSEKDVICQSPYDGTDVPSGEWG
jgi:hypothetical protein